MILEAMSYWSVLVIFAWYQAQRQACVDKGVFDLVPSIAAVTAEPRIHTISTPGV
jgi:hypothetical protein